MTWAVAISPEIPLSHENNTHTLKNVNDEQ